MTKPEKDTVKTLRILSLVFGLISLAFLAVAIFIFVYSNNFTSLSARTEGIVVRMSNSGSKAAPIVQYVVAGKTYEHRSDVKSSSSLFSVGKRVIMLYDPQDPQNSQIDGYRVDWLLALIFGIVGLAFGLTTVVLLLINVLLRQKRRPQLVA